MRKQQTILTFRDQLMKDKMSKLHAYIFRLNSTFVLFVISMKKKIINLIVYDFALYSFLIYIERASQFRVIKMNK